MLVVVVASVFFNTSMIFVLLNFFSLFSVWEIVFLNCRGTEVQLTFNLDFIKNNQMQCYYSPHMWNIGQNELYIAHNFQITF